MSEKLYRFLLRLYPSRFRQQYADQAMQLFRDRLRDERGLWKRARLWMDVLLDLSVSVPREHRRAPSHPAASNSGVPSFLVLENEPLRPDMFLLGTVLALVAVGAFGFLLTHGGNRALPADLQVRLRNAMTPAVRGDAGQESSAAGGAGEAPLLTAAERQLVIRKIVEAVQEYDAAESARVEAGLAAYEAVGDYDGITNGSVFAMLLTRQMSAMTRRMTVTVLCGEQPLPGSEMWVRSSAPGATVNERIDNRFALALAPVSHPRP